MKVALTVVRGPGEGTVREFSEPRGFIIGRAKDADHPLPDDDPYVSRRHLYLEICPPSCRVQNLSNTNIAHLNGVPITEPRDLGHGDVLELGYTRLLTSIEMHVVPVLDHCRSCGRPVELVSGEAQPDRCDACIGESRAPRPLPEALVVRCACGLDLTERANSDSRARDLCGVVEYACDDHVPREATKAIQIGPYETCRLLGEGGFGAVYLAYHRTTGRLVALKQLKDLRQTELVKRFQREMQFALEHTNVVRPIDAGIDDQDAPYLVTEYVAGGSLQQHADANGGRLPREQAVSIVSTALDGLAYIHSQQVIHRDIKPENILLRRNMHTENEEVVPKLADFGLAISYARAGGTRLTKQGVAMGTLMYMSPEQVRNTANAREPSDVYSMGVTLYYLLTGRYTFDFPAPAEVAEFAAKERAGWKRPQDILPLLMEKRRIEHPFVIILNDKPIPILERDSSLPSALAEVVDRAVQKERGDRFQSAAQFQTALREANGSARRKR